MTSAAQVNGMIALALEAFRQRHFSVARRWLDAAFIAPLPTPVANPALFWLYCICAAESHDPQAAQSAFDAAERLFGQRAASPAPPELEALRDLARKWTAGGMHSPTQPPAPGEGLGWAAS